MSEPTKQANPGIIQIGSLQLAELPMLGLVIAATFCGLVLIMLIALTFLLLLRKSGCMRRGHLKLKSREDVEHKFLQPTTSVEHLELLTHDKPANGHVPVDHDGNKGNDGALEPLMVNDLPSPPDANDKEFGENFNRNSWPTRNTSFKLAVDEKAKMVEKLRRPTAQLIAEMDEEEPPMYVPQTAAKKKPYEPRSRAPHPAERYNKSTDSLSTRKRESSQERILTSSPESDRPAEHGPSPTMMVDLQSRPDAEMVNETKKYRPHRSLLRKNSSGKHNQPSSNSHDEVDREREETFAVAKEKELVEKSPEMSAERSANMYENVSDLMRLPPRPRYGSNERVRDSSPEKPKQADKTQTTPARHRSSEREEDEILSLSAPGLRLMDFASDRSSLPSPDGAVRISGSTPYLVSASEAQSSKTVAFKATDDFIDHRIDLTQSPTFDNERAFNRYSESYRAVPMPVNEDAPVSERWTMPAESSGRPSRLRIPPPTLPKPKYYIAHRGDGSHYDIPRAGYLQPRRSLPGDQYSPTSENIQKAFNEATNPIPSGDRPILVRGRRPRSLDPGEMTTYDSLRTDEPRPNRAIHRPVYGRHSLAEGTTRSQSLRYPSSSAEGRGVPTGSYRQSPQEPNYPPDRDPRTDERVYYRPRNFVLGNQPYTPVNYSRHDPSKRYSDPRLLRGPIRNYPPIRHPFIGPPRLMMRFPPSRPPFAGEYQGPHVRHPAYSRHSITEGMRPASQQASEGMRPASQQASEGMRPASQQASEGMRPASQQASEGMRPASQQASEGMRPASQQASEGMRPASQQASEGMRPASQQASETSDATLDTTSDANKQAQGGSKLSSSPSPSQASSIPPWERSGSKLSLSEQAAGDPTTAVRARFVPATVDNDETPVSRSSPEQVQPHHQKPPLPPNTPRMRIPVGEVNSNYMSHYHMPGYPRRVATVKPHGPIKHNSYNSLVGRVPPPFTISGSVPRPVLVRPGSVEGIENGGLGQPSGRSLSYKASLM